MTNNIPELVSDIMSDIINLRSTILYLENRILIKQLAMQEIIHGAQCRADPAPEPVVAPVVKAEAPMFKARPTVVEMITSVLPELPADQAWSVATIKLACQRKYPDWKIKIACGMPAACRRLVTNGVLEKTMNGFGLKL